jgi:hypothetical protein
MKSKIVKKKDLDVLIENTMVKAGLKLIKEDELEPKSKNEEVDFESQMEPEEDYMGFFNCSGGKCENDQQIADKILSIITNNPEKIKNLKPSTYEKAYHFTINGSQRITSREMYGKYELSVGELTKRVGHEIKCDSNTCKNIFKSLEKIDPSSRVNILSSFDESKKLNKPLINEEFKSELEKFNKLSNFKY